MDIIASECRHVTGRRTAYVSASDSSVLTALGDHGPDWLRTLEEVEPMGRGQTKAKQVKVAHQLKYKSDGTGLTGCMRIGQVPDLPRPVRMSFMADKGPYCHYQT